MADGPIQDLMEKLRETARAECFAWALEQKDGERRHKACCTMAKTDGYDSETVVVAGKMTLQTGGGVVLCGPVQPLWCNYWDQVTQAWEALNG